MKNLILKKAQATISYLLLFPIALFAQLDLRPLKVGEMMPDMAFNTVINYKSNTLRISDLKGKLVILDFWSTSCRSCIELLPKMELLQSDFGDKLAIITMGFNVVDNKEISEFLGNRKKQGNELKLTTVVQNVGEKTLFKLFPMSYMPHEVWIGPDGSILGITDAIAVNKQNIAAILKGEKLNFALKKKHGSLRYDTPFLFGKIDKSRIKYGSMFCNYIDTISANGSEFGTQQDSTYWRFYDVNLDVVKLYRNIYGLRYPALKKSLKKEILLDSKDSTFFNIDVKRLMSQRDYDNWKLDSFRLNHIYGYELILPRKKFKFNEACDYMISDLDRFFKIESRVENRKVDCLILIKKTVGSDNRSNLPDKAIKLSKVTPMKISTSIDELIKKLDTQMTGKKVILNESNSSGQIELILPKGYQSLNTLVDTRTVLQNAGFDIIEAKRDLDVLVLYDRKNIN